MLVNLLSDALKLREDPEKKGNMVCTRWSEERYSHKHGDSFTPGVNENVKSVLQLLWRVLKDLLFLSAEKFMCLSKTGSNIVQREEGREITGQPHYGPWILVLSEPLSNPLGLVQNLVAYKTSSRATRPPISRSQSRVCSGSRQGVSLIWGSALTVVTIKPVLVWLYRPE